MKILVLVNILWIENKISFNSYLLIFILFTWPLLLHLFGVSFHFHSVHLFHLLHLSFHLKFHHCDLHERKASQKQASNDPLLKRCLVSSPDLVVKSFKYALFVCMFTASVAPVMNPPAILFQLSSTYLMWTSPHSVIVNKAPHIAKLPKDFIMLIMKSYIIYNEWFTS